MVYTDADFEAMKTGPGLVRRYMRDCFLRWMANGLDGARCIAELNAVSDDTLFKIANKGERS